MADRTAYYFAYGSNMLQARLFDRVGPTDPQGPARLEGRRLSFSKPSIKSKQEGRADIPEQKGSVVEGVLYAMSPRQLDALDGFKGGYRREKVRVRMEDGREVEATTYRSRRSVAGLRPNRQYLDDLIAGAEENGLSAEYVDFLKAQETV